MSNKPNIFAHCKAGCLWEVPHKADVDEEFEAVRTEIGERLTAAGLIESAAGSYIGTGADARTVLTFDALPQVVFIYTSSWSAILYPVIARGIIISSGSYPVGVSFASHSEKREITLKGDMNSAGVEYFYIAFHTANFAEIIQTKTVTVEIEATYLDGDGYLTVSRSAVIEEGKTWQQFVDGKYYQYFNDYIDSTTNRVCLSAGGGTPLKTSTGEYVLGTDVVKEGTYYCDVRDK